MSVKNENAAGSESVVLERPAAGGVYASLFEKINLNPVSELSALDIWQDAQAMSDATADERLTAGMQVFLECLTKSGSKVEKLDKNLIDHHIAELDYQISRQLDAVMHSEEFQAVESLWRGVKSLVDKTDFRQNVKVELLDMSKEDLRQDFEDSPEIIQSGLYKQTYIDEYDTPGGEPIAALISAYEFDASAQDVALLRNISKVSAAAHMPFIGSAGPKFFLKDSMEEVAAIKDIGNYFDRAEYIKWKSFRETDDARYIGLVMPRVLGRLPYGPDTVPVRSFNYVEEVKGPDHDKYLWTNASFAFASNMVRSFINNGWCVQIRGPQAGGAVQDLPIHLYDLGTGNQVKIPSEVMIPETREFEFANLGFIPLSYYKNRDYSCFFSANSTQKPALYDTADEVNSQGLSFNPAFLRAINQLSQLSDILFTDGSQGISFELQARPVPQVVETQLTIDGQPLHYFNQMADWQSFRWPGETYKPGTMLTWTTVNAGARLFGDYSGTWGFIRWLDQGKRQQLDRSQWMMSFTAPDGRTLQWVLRSQLGKGPLALLDLRGFTLPDQIFSVDSAATAQALMASAGNSDMDGGE